MENEPAESVSDEQLDEQEEIRLARFDERLVAFFIDGLLFYSVFRLGLKLSGSTLIELFTWPGKLWAGFVLLSFLLYHALLSAKGLPTAGKALLGLRVLGQDGQPPQFAASLIRSASYLLSSFFSAGFLLALFDEKSRALHDRLAGTRVDAVRPRSAALTGFAAAAVLAVLGAAFAWQTWGAPLFYRLQTLAYARRTLKNVAFLEETYRAGTGHYTTELDQLAQLTPDPDFFVRRLGLTFDADRGVKITLGPGARSFKLTAYARDRQSSRVIVTGPVDKGGIQEVL
jgi:uncharacterized RDD family membrane protein YckC